MRTLLTLTIATLALAACGNDATTGPFDATPPKGDGTVLDTPGSDIVDTPVAPDTPGGDTTLEIPPCNGVSTNDPCDTKGTECADTSLWCGLMMTNYGCHCNGTEWLCYSAAAPVDCHECCQEAMGGMYFCSDGQCLKASGCLALDCCVPGPKGDAWCKGTFGECSKCTVVSNDGRCNPVDCGG